jgi:hypothetical protein
MEVIAISTVLESAEVFGSETNFSAALSHGAAMSRSAAVVKRKDGRMLNMPENSEGARRIGDLLSLANPDDGKKEFCQAHDVREELQESGNDVYVPGFL